MKRRAPYDPIAELLGLDWHDAFGALHTAGGAVLSAFGAGAVVPKLAQLESPILPDWAKTTQGPPPGAPSPTGGRVPPGAMPMSGKPPPKMKPPGKAQPSSAPTTTTKQRSFLSKWGRPIEIGAGAAVALGLVGVLAHYAGKGKRK